MSVDKFNRFAIFYCHQEGLELQPPRLKKIAFLEPELATCNGCIDAYAKGTIFRPGSMHPSRSNLLECYFG